MTVLAEQVRVYVDPKSYPFLDGLTLDFTESLMESAFGCIIRTLSEAAVAGRVSRFNTFFWRRGHFELTANAVGCFGW